MEHIETDLLIVGAGPAGASLACFLASYGTKSIEIAMHLKLMFSQEERA